jgi:hypothetical protein
LFGEKESFVRDFDFHILAVMDRYNPSPEKSRSGAAYERSRENETRYYLLTPYRLCVNLLMRAREREEPAYLWLHAAFIGPSPSKGEHTTIKRKAEAVRDKGVRTEIGNEGVGTK